MQPLPGTAGASDTYATPEPPPAAAADIAAVLKGNQALFSEKVCAAADDLRLCQ
jgi:hypothetical protein